MLVKTHVSQLLLPTVLEWEGKYTTWNITPRIKAPALVMVMK